MNALLGKLARGARALGLGRMLRALRDLADAAMLRAGRPPLHAGELRGFLRHRSFLAGVERGDYEPTLRDLIVDAFEPGCLFVDVGAHIGFYSLLADEAGATVIALEPDPYNRAALRRNLRGRRAQVLAAAASDAVGVASFHPSTSTTGSSLVDRSDIEMLDAVPVETTTVDALTEGRDVELLVLKVDVEGAEPSVLAGARRALRDIPRAVVIAEVHPQALAAANAGPADVVRPLEEAGFEVRFVDQDGNIGALPATPSKGNVLATRGTRAGAR